MKQKEKNCTWKKNQPNYRFRQELITNVDLEVVVSTTMAKVPT